MLNLCDTTGGIPVPIQPGNGPTVSFLVNCNGKESNLTKCAEAAAGLGTSQTPHAVGVLCKGDWGMVGGALCWVTDSTPPLQ